MDVLPSNRNGEIIMICPKCGHEFKSPVAVAGGKVGGKAKNPRKGFGSPAVLMKAMETRKRKESK